LMDRKCPRRGIWKEWRSVPKPISTPPKMIP
jgi:hypothetical protein